MAGVSCSSTLTVVRLPLHFQSKTIHSIRCSSAAPDNNRNNHHRRTTETPRVLKIAVSGVTELLRLLSSFNKPTRLNGASDQLREGFSISGIDDVVMILKADYANAYFVTGVFTSAIYTEDCVFEDPTIRFRGKELYSRNLKLLVPFFDSPSIGLEKIEKGINSEPNFVQASWKLRFFKYGTTGVGLPPAFEVILTYLKLPWRPLICIDGSTVYDLDDKFKITRHAESWNVSAIEAIGQLLTPTYGKSND